MKTKTKLWIGIPCAVIFFLFVGVLIGMNDESTTSQSSLGIGETGKLYLEGETLIPVCKTKAYLSELIDASVAKDTIGYRELIFSPKCYMHTSIEPYGEVLVIDSGFGTRQVRFTHPDGYHYGKTAWTYMEFIIAK